MVANLKNYLVGFQYVYKNLVSVLENEGIQEITPEVGKEFDPKVMNAVDTEVGEKDGMVLKVYGKGYKLHEHIVRPAMVKVSVVKQVEDKESSEIPEAQEEINYGKRNYLRY